MAVQIMDLNNFEKKSDEELWKLSAEEAELYHKQLLLYQSEIPYKSLSDFDGDVTKLEDYNDQVRDQKDYIRATRLITLCAFTLEQREKLKKRAIEEGVPAEHIEYYIQAKQAAYRMMSRKWRLNNLYYITDKHGRKCKFHMNFVQETLYDNMHNKNIILKARQFGITTFACILALDFTLEEANVTCGIVAHNKEDAEKFFNKKVKYAYNNLPQEIRDERPQCKDDKKELHIRHDPEDEETDEKSYLHVATSFRSDTAQFLHISEWAKCYIKDPQKAEEIRTGALNAVPPSGYVMIESTAEGNEGPFYDFCQIAMQKHLSGEHLTSMDYKFHFFPWWLHDDYVLHDPHVVITERLNNYFQKLQKDPYVIKSGHRFTNAQIRWYSKKEEEQKDQMKQEYPSTPEEAFEQALDGAYYGREMNNCYATNRIGKFPINPSLQVHTAWDLGIHDSMAIWFFQNVGGMINVVDYYEDYGYGLPHYIRILREKAEDFGFMYGAHLAPHDINNKEMTTGKSRLDTAAEMGITFTAVNKISVKDGIDNVRKLLPLMCFDESSCEKGIKHLTKYSREWDDKKGVWKAKPRHDKHSHGCLRGDSLVEMANGSQKRIMDIKIGDYVKTPLGAREVLNSGISKFTNEILKINTVDGSELYATPEHKIFTEDGVVLADTLSNLTYVVNNSKESNILWKNLQSSLMTENLCYRQMVITELGTGIRNMESATCIEPFMLTIMVQYLKDIISTTRTMINPIMIYRTLNAYLNLITLAYQPRIANGLGVMQTSNNLLLQGNWQRNGMLAKRADNGTVRMVKNLGRKGNRPRKNVFAVERLMKPITQINRSIAQTLARHILGSMGRGEQLLKHARSVELNLKQEETARNLFATSTQITSVEKINLDQKIPVYDLTVDKDHCYFANGLLVSNSDAFRYLCTGHSFNLGAVGVFANVDRRPARKVEQVQSAW